MENLHALTHTLENDHVIYHKGYNASEIRRQFVMTDLPEIYDRKELTELLLKILDLAADGLKIRGFGEEKYLAPLYPRAEQLMSPARQMKEGLQKGRTMEDYIREYGELSP